MLTAKASEEERVAGFALGADDYVVKPFSPRELVYRIKAVLRRQQKGDLDHAEPLSSTRGSLIIDGKATSQKGGGPININPDEFKVLYILATHPGRVFTRENWSKRPLVTNSKATKKHRRPY